MELIDCGVSGSSDSYPEISWDEIGLPSTWRSTLRLLSGTKGPRPVQREAFSNMRILENRRNILVSAPTNAGKSLVGISVLLDAVRQGGRAVLLEPLRALAREKADELIAHSNALSNSMGIEIQIKLTTGDYRLTDEYFTSPPPESGQLIIATPERFDAILRNPLYQDWVESVEAVCVDEAHLISNPRRGATLEYVITSLLSQSRPPRLVLLSASLGQTDRIQKWLTPCDEVKVTKRYPTLQKNIAVLSEGEEPESAVINLVKDAIQNPEASVVVFVYQTASTTALCRKLNEQLRGSLGTKGALPYHAQMSSAQRDLTRKSIEDGTSRCVVSTTALGLGVNLPATHVIIRDVTFPGIGPLPITDILQMAGRAGRANRPGIATVLLRPSDSWALKDLTQQLQDEPLPEMVSSFDKVPSVSRSREDNTMLPSVASLLALQLAKKVDNGLKIQDLKNFFLRSLGGDKITCHVEEGLRWLNDPSRLLSYRNEDGEYALTTLGRQTVRGTLPLEISAGYAQLIRDLLQSDSDDLLLSKWTALDHLIILDILSSWSPSIRRFNKSLPDQLETWMESHPDEVPMTYFEWIRGDEGTSRADQLLGSLGYVIDLESARKKAILATLHAVILYERGHGVSVSDLERRWSLNNLAGIEEQWRDRLLWLLSAVGSILETRCFFFCLKEHCQADDTRIKRVTHILRLMELQLFDLQEQLRYCSPLGGLLKSLHRIQKNRIGATTIRRLEASGITTVAQLGSLSELQLVELGLRKETAMFLRSYLKRRSQ